MPATTDESTHTQTLKALLVASGPAMLEKMVRPIKAAGLSVNACESFEDAEHLYDSQSLVVLPIKEGEQDEAKSFVDWLRSQKHAPYILGVGRCEPAQRQGLVAKMGLNDLIALPCDSTEVEDRLASFTRWQQQGRFAATSDSISSGPTLTPPIPKSLTDLPTSLSQTTRVTLFAGAESSEGEKEAPEVIFCREAPVGIAMFDRELRYVLANPRWLKQFGLEDKKVIGRSQFEVFPKLHPNWRKIYERCLEGETRRGRETVDAVEMRWEVRPWHHRAGQVGGVTIAFDEAWKSDESKPAPLRTEAVPALLDGPAMLLCLKGTVVESNAAARELGLDTPEDAFLEALRASPEKLPLTNLVDMPEGRLAWSNTLQRDAKGNAHQVLRVGAFLPEALLPKPGEAPSAREATVELVAEEAKEPEIPAFDEETLNGLTELVWKANPRGEITFFNQAWLEYRDRPLKREVNGGWLDGLHASDAQATKAVVAGAIREQKSLEHRFRLRSGDGDYQEMAMWVRPFHSDDDQLLGFYGACRPAEAASGDGKQDSSIWTTALLGDGNAKDAAAPDAHAAAELEEVKRENAELMEALAEAESSTGSAHGILAKLIGALGSEEIYADDVPLGELIQQAKERLPQWQQRQSKNAEDLEAFREIFDHVSSGIVLLDDAGKPLFANQATDHVLGFGIQETGDIESWLRRGAGEEHAKPVLRIWQEDVWQRQLTKVLALKNSQGALREVRFEPQLLLEDNRLLLTLQDVTDSKRGEEAMRDSELRFRALFRESLMGIALIDAEQKIYDINPALERVLKVPRRQIICRPFDDCLHPADRERKAEVLKELLQSPKRSASLELRMLSKESADGTPNEETWVRLHISLVRDVDQRVLFTAYFIQDVTEQKRVRAELQISQEQNRALLEVIPDLIFLTDRRGHVIDFMPGEDTPLALPEEGVIGQRLEEVLPPFGGELDRLIQEAYAEEDVVTHAFTWQERDYGARLVACKPDSTVITIHVATTAETPAPPAAETTPEVPPAPEIPEATVLQSLSFESAPEGMVITDYSGSIKAWNHAATRLFGYSESESLGQPFPALFGVESIEGLTRRLEQVDGHWYRGELPCIRKDQSEGLVELTFGAVKDDEGQLQGQLITIRPSAPKPPAPAAEPPVDRKALEEQLRRETMADLVPQMHQRLRNNLQIIGTLLNLQYKAQVEPTTREALRTSRNRSHALMILHEQIHNEHDEQAIDFGKFVQALAAHLLASYEASERVQTRLLVEGSLDLQAASPLALITNELLSNAIHHGFPDDRRGVVQVAMRLTTGSGELTVTDNGIGLPSAHKGAGMGLQIVKTLASQIGGTLEKIDSTETEFRVYFKTSLRQ